MKTEINNRSVDDQVVQPTKVETPKQSASDKRTTLSGLAQTTLSEETPKGTKTIQVESVIGFAMHSSCPIR